MDNDRYLLQQGSVPQDVVIHTRVLLVLVTDLIEIVTEFVGLLKQASLGESDWIPNELIYAEAEAFGKLEVEGLAHRELLQDWTDQPDDSESARWLTAHASNTDQYILNTVVINVHDRLQDLLWNHCAGAICTSATLATTDGFEHFIDQVGLPLDINQLELPSPFDFGKRVRLSVPRMDSLPQQKGHNSEVAKLLPALLKTDRSGLVIFSSRASLDAVIESLPKAFLSRCLVQGQDPWEVTMEKHKSRIANNRPSYLFGLASFREGIDLPDDLCRHVIITRLPFEVPSDPILTRRKEHLALRGITGYPAFLSIELPEMTLRLKQACGRLMRSENDYGKITILDARIVTKSYGKNVLDVLPPYQRDF